MKIVDRKTFMQMPKGTVFCKFPRLNEKARSYDKYMFSINEPQIKMNNPGETEFDFSSLSLGSDLAPVESTNSEEYSDILTDMEHNLGKEVPFEHSYGRDGLFEGDEVGFAIFSRSEVEEMITLLKQALQDGYKTID